MITRRYCYYIDQMMTHEHDDGTKHYYPAIVEENISGYSRTNWDYGTDFKLAKEAVDSLNEKRGITRDEVFEIVVSSMFPKARR